MVGDYTISDYDYVLNIYLEDVNAYGEKSYYITDEIPTSGYVYDGYTCENDSAFSYDSENKTTIATLNKKDICKIYFKLEE